MPRFRGIWGRPYIDLEPYIDTSRFEEIDDEICMALTRVQTEYTGGSHKWMGIVPPSLEDEPYIDYGQVIADFSRDEFIRFVSLGDHPEQFDPDRQHEYQFGEERDHPLTRRQMLYLKYRYGVYFPWKVFYEMIPTLNWDDKSHGIGKRFKPEAEEHFPKLIAFVRSLPMRAIGRCNILGLEANDHGTVHTDLGEAEKNTVDQFITICPRGDKRVYLWDDAEQHKELLDSRVYWFNDSDYHGVEADPYFRYSVRVDGYFDEAFFERVRRDNERSPQKAKALERIAMGAASR
jgi:hypothetical protein